MTMIKHSAGRVLVSLLAAAGMALGGVATAHAAESTPVDVSAKETIVLNATASGAFTGKADTIQAIRLGTYISAESTDGGKTLSGVSIETEQAYKQAVADALTAAKVANVDADNPVNTLVTVAGDTGVEAVPYSSELRKTATALGKDAAITGATGEKGAVSSANGGTDNVLTFSGLTAGYYLVRDTSAKSAAIPMLVSTKINGLSFPGNELGVINYKSISDNPGGNGDGKENVTPPEKTVGGKAGQYTEAHKVGDTVDYTIDQKVPNTTGYPGFVMKLEDTMGEGLDYKAGSATFTVDGKALDAQYVDEAVAGRVVTWSFGLQDDSVNPAVRNILKDGAAAIFTPGAKVEVKYQATINSDVVKQDAGKNTVKLIYSNNPNAWNTQFGNEDGRHEVTVTTGTVHVFSAKPDKQTALPGTSGHVVQGGKTLNWIDNGDGSYTLADADDKNTTQTIEFTDANKATATLKGVNELYEFVQDGVANGMSTGYKADFQFTVDASADPDTATVSTDPKTNANLLGFQKDANTVGFMSVANAQQLPQTGVSQGLMLIMIAMGLAAVCVPVLTRMRRLNND